MLSNLVLFYFLPLIFFFEKSLPSSCLVFLCELPRVNACICFLSPLPKNQCFMDRLRLWTKLNFISLWSACLVCVISAFESQCDFFYIRSEAASTPGYVLQMPIQNVQLSAENKWEPYYFPNHLQCSLTQVCWQFVFWFCSRLGIFLHFLMVDYLFSWIDGHW